MNNVPEAAIAPVNAINAFVDYITNKEHVWNPEKYIAIRNVSGVTENGTEFKFSYSYTIGASYMSGRLGKDFDKIEVFYRSTQGFQIKLSRNNGAVIQGGYAPYNETAVKELLNSYANN
jgi:hypothetical protein